jgi:hypothetical protein
MKIALVVCALAAVASAQTYSKVEVSSWIGATCPGPGETGTPAGALTTVDNDNVCREFPEVLAGVYHRAVCGAGANPRFEYCLGEPANANGNTCVRGPQCAFGEGVIESVTDKDHDGRPTVCVSTVLGVSLQLTCSAPVDSTDATTTTMMTTTTTTLRRR